MERVLDGYRRPYDPAFPVVCVDETRPRRIGEMARASGGSPRCTRRPGGSRRARWRRHHSAAALLLDRRHASEPASPPTSPPMLRRTFFMRSLLSSGPVTDFDSISACSRRSEMENSST